VRFTSLAHWSKDVHFGECTLGSPLREIRAVAVNAAPIA
jgi:hypothetical protein